MSSNLKAQIEKTIIKKLLYADQIPLITYNIDKDLIGGLIIQLGDRTIDLSARKKIVNLKNSLFLND
jgi:F-type H+-transporting ATPase subunit O